MTNDNPLPGAGSFQAFAAAHGLTDLILDYDYISGLVLALASAPDMIEPEEWLAMVFIDEHETAPVDMEVLQLLLNQLADIWNHWAGQIDGEEDGPLQLPEDYRLEAGAPSAALSRFCVGISHGFDWLENDWNDFFDMMDGAEDLEEMEGVFSGTLASAMVLADPQLASEVMSAEGVEPMDLDEALELLAEGLLILGKLGRLSAGLEEDEDEEDDEN